MTPDELKARGCEPVPTDGALEKLREAQRVLGESRMIRTDADPSALPDDKCTEVIEQVRAYLKEKGLKQNQLAKALCISASTVSSVFSGSYAGNAKNIVIAMDRWLDRRKQADENPRTSDFVWTGVALNIRTAAMRTIAAADMGLDSRIGLVWGEPGCGKTLALQSIAERENGILIEMDFHSASPTGVLEKIGRALRLSIPNRSRELFEAIVDRLRGSGKLIIVDEIHALLAGRDDKAFHTLRRLSDQTGCPQLWSATCDLVGELRSRERKREPLAQITSRIGIQVHLTSDLHSKDGGSSQPLYSVEEVLKIFAQNEIKLTRDAGKFLAKLCRSPHLGLLRTCTTLVGHATVMNKGRVRELTPSLLWEASKLLFQPSELRAMLDCIGDEVAEPRLAKVG